MMGWLQAGNMRRMATATERASRLVPGRVSLPFGVRAAWLAALVVSLVAGGMIAASPPAEARRDGPAVQMLRARSTAALDALEPKSAEAHWSQAVRRPVTDLIVRLKPWGAVPLSVALTARGSTVAVGADRSLFAAELIIAAGGRIQIEDRAACGPWVGDTALCRTECDGGAFAIVRRAQGPSYSLTLLLGRVAAIADAGFGESIRLGACSDVDAGGGLAAKAGQAVAEVPLDPK